MENKVIGKQYCEKVNVKKYPRGIGFGALKGK